MELRDRIIDFRRVPADELLANPKNWRTHPAGQRDALQGVLAEVGFVDAMLARQLPDGSLELIDGHLRQELSADAVVPVLVTDLTEAEADIVLATFDPLTDLAGIDEAKLESLLHQVETNNPEVQRMLDEMATAAGIVPPAEPDGPEDFPEVDEDIATDHECPQCGYKWSGGK